VIRLWQAGEWPQVAVEVGSTDRAEARARGRALIATLLAEWREAPIGTEVVALCPDCGGDHGRPMLMVGGRPIDAHVSIAHSGPFTAVALHHDLPLGIDIEERTADPERLAAIRGVTGIDTDDPLRHWTRVEAVLKAHGDGLRIDPSRVRVTSIGSDTIATIDGLAPSYRVAELPVDGLCISFAVASAPEPLRSY
jgi:4'-phosphopantetheinyl transferase